MTMRRSVTRRDFLQGASALGLTAGLAPGLGSGPAKAAPARGGHLRIAADGGSLSDVFDPHLALGVDHTTSAIMACYDTLTEISPSGEPVPSLAEGWETSDDGTTWRFKLRSGAEFHNGKSVTPADVIWSLGYHLEENNKFAEGQQIVSNFEKMEADGDTVVLVQKQINFDLPAHLSSFGLLIAPEGTEDWDSGIGSGPYARETWEPGQTFIGKKYANFYRDDQGFVDSVELLNITDPASRSTALLTGSVDAIGSPETKTAGRIAKTDGFDLVAAPGNQHFTTAMRTDVDPFTDNHLRLAVKYGIKRPEIVEKVLGGYGYVGNDHPIGRGTQFFNRDLPQREYDPDKAKYHLKQAGLESVDLTFQTSDGAFSGAVDMGQLMQSSMKPAGINVTIRREPADGYWSNVWLKAPWCAVYWNGRPTVDWMLTTSYISTSSWNDTYFKNETFDQTLVAARTERDQDKRRQMYFDLQEMLHNEGGTTVVAFASYLMAASSKLGHGKVGAYRRLDDSRMARRWWFES